MLQIQNNFLSDIERKKRNRVIKKSKPGLERKKSVEIDVQSLSDSGISNRRKVLIREAERTLNLGKSLGITIIGDEKEFIDELVRIEETFSRRRRLQAEGSLFQDRWRASSLLGARGEA
ncbi:uncharacterized protein LOC120172691 [Hibiscus syriacus]|uniref:uncharacterized protein LOC120172691 n=1 Tax=Hibiscus syriacus TaxID=106335 RepID=UPI001923CD0A|nr:uncharacterized protein LOC120172691 [Hibiscus syriacus]